MVRSLPLPEAVQDAIRREIANVDFSPRTPSRMSAMAAARHEINSVIASLDTAWGSA